MSKSLKYKLLCGITPVILIVTGWLIQQYYNSFLMRLEVIEKKTDDVHDKITKLESKYDSFVDYIQWRNGDTDRINGLKR